MASLDVNLDKGLPVSLDAEKYVLGSILLDDTLFVEVAATLEAQDFSLEKHRRIFLRMGELNARGERIDRLTVAEELMRHNQLEACDGVGYLVSLDDGLPQIRNLDSYVRLVKDKSLLRRVIYASQSLINRCLAGEEAPQEILANAEEALLRLGESSTRTTLFSPGEIIDEFQGGLNAFLDPERRIQGLSTGFRRFDEMTGGLHPGELVIVAGRPSMGKTALALNIAQHVAVKLQKTVAVFSLEMSKEALLMRLLCAAARVDSHRFRQGYLDAEERRRLQAAAAELVEAPLYIDETSGSNLLEMHAKLRRLKAERPLGLVVLDYLQLMSSRGRFDSRVQEISALSRGLKLLAKELGVPMLVLSQLNRMPETRKDDHRPQLSDLRDSGSIEQDADVVAFIFREEVYKRDREDLRGEAELLLSKQRNGPTGAIKLVFLHHLTKFENRVSDLESDDAPPE
ncbi:MAG: replicative DNA helicase [Bryobacterales bacterium]|nr:replicative DNA helicase [Bryobacterales bacterium]